MATLRLPAEQRKKQILTAAVKIFARSNFQSARMVDIAAECGISDAAIYKHFPSKKAIYLDILQHMSRRILTFWQEEVDNTPDAIEALRNMGVTYYKRMAKHPDELRVQFQAISETSDPEIAAHLRQDHIDYMAFIGGVIEKGKRQGKIQKEVDVETLSWLLNGVGILMNMTNLLSFKEKFDEDEVLRLTDHIIDSMKP
jgi:AcrR family transcriptional regulator